MDYFCTNFFLMKAGVVIHYLGRFLVSIAAFMSTSILWALYYHEDDCLLPLAISVLATLSSGLLAAGLTWSLSKTQINLKEGYMIVTLTWVLVGVYGALPFMLTGSIPSFIDAFFESVSGFTTTGSSILTDIEALPYSVLYWRSLTHWAGGMGIIVLAIAIMPAFKMAGYQLFSLESSGISNDKLKPRMRDTAQRLWGIYVGLTIVSVLFLLAGEMNFFESVCHAFGAIATGGYGTKNASMAAYSPYSQYVIMITMLVSGINFSLHYFLITGKGRKVFRDEELRTYLGIVVVTSLAIAISLLNAGENSVEKALRDSFFQVISIITSTGFATADYLQWPSFGWILIFFLMFIGGSIGSTSGGVKVVRYVVAFKAIRGIFFKLKHPTAVRSLRLNGQPVHTEQVNAILVFIALYMLVFLVGTLVITLLGLDLHSAAGAVITTLGGIGPGIGTVGPVSNFAHVSDAGKVVLALIMIIGRLEILTFIALLSPAFWKK